MDGEKPFLEHLEELRSVLLRGMFAVLILLPVGFFLAGRLLPLLPRLLGYLGGEELKFHYFTPLEPFLIQLKLSLVFALAAALPYLAFLAVRFVSPALYVRERKAMALTAGTVTALFFGGAAFAFFTILPLVLKFAYSYRSAELTPVIGLGNFIGLAAMLLLGFGVMFQFPVLVILLVKAGLIRIATLRKGRPFVIVGILVLAAVLTPPDVLSQLLMTIPTYLLFELALLVAARLEPPAPPEAEPPPEPPGPTPADPAAAHDPYRRAARPPRRRIRPLRRR